MQQLNDYSLLQFLYQIFLDGQKQSFKSGFSHPINQATNPVKAFFWEFLLWHFLLFFTIN